MKRLLKNSTTLFWAALSSGILMFAKQVAGLFGFDISDELIKRITETVGTLLSLLVLVGVLTNSNEADKFEAKVLKKK